MIWQTPLYISASVVIAGSYVFVIFVFIGAFLNSFFSWCLLVVMFEIVHIVNKNSTSDNVVEEPAARSNSTFHKKVTISMHTPTTCNKQLIIDS